MSDAATCAGAIFAESDMIVSGGNVTIKGSTAHYDGGRGSGSLALSRNRGRGIPLKKWHKEGHGLGSLGAEGSPSSRLESFAGRCCPCSNAASHAFKTNVYQLFPLVQLFAPSRLSYGIVEKG